MVENLRDASTRRVQLFDGLIKSQISEKKIISFYVLEYLRLW